MLMEWIWFIFSTVLLSVESAVHSSQDHLVREHFFEVIHVSARDGARTQYTTYKRYEQINNGEIDISSLRAFEFPCGKTENQSVEVQVKLLLPCTENEIGFIQSFDRKLETSNECTMDETGFEYVEVEILKGGKGKWDFPVLTPSDNYSTPISFVQYPDDRPIVKLSYWSDECSSDCGRSPDDVILKNVRCESVRKKLKRGTVLACNFDPDHNSSWSFVSPGLPVEQQWNPEMNFRVAGSKGSTLALMQMPSAKRPPAMVVSPYYAQTAESCKIQFNYHLRSNYSREHKQHTGRIQMVVSTQRRQLDNENVPESVKSEWIRPHIVEYLSSEEFYQPSIPIHIGHISHPTRIRIECHNSVTDIGLSLNTDCYVGDITLIDCEEHLLFNRVCTSDVSSFMCSGPGRKKCIGWEYVCDGYRDCADGEDERNCDFSVAGSYCDFENPSVLCPGWTQDTVSAKATIDGHLVIRANYTQAVEDSPLANIPKGDHTIGERGHFLWTSLSFRQSFNYKTANTKFSSPIYPPTIRSWEKKRKQQTCFLRFWYCHYTDFPLPTVKWVLYSGLLNPTTKHLPWEFENIDPSHSRRRYCDWKRAHIHIEDQTTHFRLELSISPFVGETDYILAIDDISFSTTCFPKDNFLSSFYNLNTCNVSGPFPPTTEICQKYSNQSTENNSIVRQIENGAQRWVAPETNEYRIELCGASGGSLPGAHRNNYGGCVYVLVNLTAFESLIIMLGQKGESPCNDEDFLSSRFSSICHLSFNSTLQKLSLLPGSGGGGASRIMLANYKTIMVAGGGGGLFVDTVEVDEKIAFGGSPPKEPPSRSSRNVPIDREIFAGYGGSMKKITDFPTNCSECKEMAGNLTTGSAGRCVVRRRWMYSGGFGGGGASCGPGGGGGGGHQGGEPGYLSSGHGGSSWVAPAMTVELNNGINSGDGYVLIHPCNVKCPSNATCHFVNPREFDVICVCSNGKTVVEGMECESVDVVPSPLSNSSYVSVAELFLAAVICTTVILGFVVCCYKRFFFFAFNRSRKGLDEVPLNIRGRREQDEEIYEERDAQLPVDANMLELLEELPKIDRTNIILKDLLGHGAFGEVYKADLLIDGVVREVAVKTLPYSTNRQSQDEFLMEAQIMNKFRHDNIISLYGVNFDLMPRYIVLELMSGGDLKTFLRSCRSSKCTTNPYDLQMIDLVKMALDVARGCEFLEANKFIHRDIAARNCLLSSREVGRVVKIADFGMARDIYSSDYYRKGGRAMLPVKWMPPEALLDGFFTSKTDVWSFGVVTWEIFSLGYMPYPGRNNMEVMDLIANGGRLEPPIGVPPQMYQLMLQCWKTDESSRPSFNTLVAWLVTILEDPLISHQPIPDRSLSIPSTAQQTPCAETPRSEITVSTVLNTPNGDYAHDIISSIPPKGFGIAYNACSPYEPRTSLAQSILQRPQYDSIEETPAEAVDSDIHHQSASSFQNNSDQSTPLVNTISNDTVSYHRRPPSTVHPMDFPIDETAPQPPPRRPTSLRTENNFINEQREFVNRSQENSR